METDSEQILAIVKDKPTTLYIYPESGDIDAVARAVKAGRSVSGAGLYWNASCLRAIRSPKFWQALRQSSINTGKTMLHRRGGGRGRCRLCKGQ
ncbi:MAG: hypothetical protein R3D62_11670 [Xanthobacteraceae bacterium]